MRWLRGAGVFETYRNLIGPFRSIAEFNAFIPPNPGIILMSLGGRIGGITYMGEGDGEEVAWLGRGGL